MRNPTKSMFAGSLVIGVLGVAALVAGPAAAQSADKPPPQPVKPQAQPGPDPELLVKPPAHGQPRLVKPAPPDRDPGMVKKPPADAKRAGEDKPRVDNPGASSRQDDCRGTAEDCRQNSPR
ncbi:hypothetical protein ACFJIS_31850 [Variovorax boronicumulans]|uniref:hypothetical protein n=1 Tax=Variovorax boronicumulans TaxID=436515 RepID=UPI0036F2DD09